MDEKQTIEQIKTGLSKFLDVQHNNFKTITCKNCVYTEFYKQDRNRSRDFIDLFFGG